MTVAAQEPSHPKRLENKHKRWTYLSEWMQHKEKEKEREEGDCDYGKSAQRDDTFIQIQNILHKQPIRSVKTYVCLAEEK